MCKVDSYVLMACDKESFNLKKLKVYLLIKHIFFRYFVSEIRVRPYTYVKIRAIVTDSKLLLIKIKNFYFILQFITIGILLIYVDTLLIDLEREATDFTERQEKKYLCLMMRKLKAGGKR